MKCAVLIIQITSAIVLRVVNRKRRPERHPQVPSGSVGVVFEVGMRWEWVEGAWVCISVKHAALTTVFSLFHHSVRSRYSNGKVMEAASTFFSLLQLVIDKHQCSYRTFVKQYLP